MTDNQTPECNVDSYFFFFKTYYLSIDNVCEDDRPHVYLPRILLSAFRGKLALVFYKFVVVFLSRVKVLELYESIPI